jgi:uncharacterized 2Fe-2S/4Fe-4S cluster protein (DUF4445 family)
MIKAVIRFDTDQKIFTCESGKTLMDILRDGGFFIETLCGGNGRCGKCAVIASGELSQLSTAEKNMLSPELLKKGYRLACLARAEGDITVTLPYSCDAVIETDSVGSAFPFAPPVTFHEMNGQSEVVFSGKTIGFADSMDSVIDTLLHDAGVEACKVANVFIAGGFGIHLDISSACRIGMLPSIFSAVAKPVGNTSLTGTSNLLLNKGAFERIVNITGRCRNIPLAGNTFFQQRFIENMLFEPQ